MRILFPFKGDNIGGSHLSTLLLIEELKKLGMEPIIVLHEEGALSGYLKERGLTYEYIPNIEPIKIRNIFHQVLEMISVSKKLKAFLHEKDIDIVHTNDMAMHYTWLFPTYSSQAKFVWHQHSQTSSPRLSFFSIFTNTVITVSCYAKKSFHFLFAKKAKVIKNPFVAKTCFPKEEAKTKLLKELGLSNGRKIVGFVGNLSFQKRPDFFLKIAEEALQLHENSYHFVLVGEKRKDTSETILRLLADQNVPENVSFMGPRFPIEETMSGFDILVAPAKEEAFGRTLIEAMLCSVPVIASDTGGHQEIIQNGVNGFLVHPDNSGSFLKEIMRVINDKEEADGITKKAMDIASHNFSIEMHTNKILGVYRNILRLN